MALGKEVGLVQATLCQTGTQLPPKRGRASPIFGRLLWPNGCMDQYATWYEGRPRTRRLSVRWGPAIPRKKAHPPHPIFGQCLLWPNSLMHEDANWYRSRPWPRPQCIRRGPSSPRKGHSSPLLFGPCLLCLRSPISAIAELSLTYMCKNMLLR